MPDVSALFIELMDKKGPMYVANKLMHKGTTRVERWKREKVVPLSHRFAVMDLLKAEGVIK